MWDFFGGGLYGLIGLAFENLGSTGGARDIGAQATGGSAVNLAALNDPTLGGYFNVYQQYQGGSAEVIPPSFDPGTPDNTPPSQTFPELPIGGVPIGALPPPLPSPSLLYDQGPSGYLGSGGLRPSSDTASEKRIRAERDRFARSLGLKVPKRKKVSTNAMAAKLARRLTVDVLKKIEMPAILRSVTAGAGVLLPRVLGPAIGAISLGSMLPEGTVGVLKNAVLNAYGRPGGQQAVAKAKAKANPADALQEITTTGRYQGGSIAVTNAKKDASDIARGIRQKMQPFPALPKPEKQTILQRLMNPNPKTLQNVKLIGAALDKARKKKATPADLLAVTAAITPTGVAPIPAPSYYIPPLRIPASSSSSSACSCGPKKKRGPARKCLERATVVYKTGRMKGKSAGTKCIRYAT